MGYMENLSKNMRVLRGSRPQTEFAEAIGIAKSTVQAIEKGNTSIRLDTLELICDQLGISMGALLSDELTPAGIGVLPHVLNGVQWFGSLSESEQMDMLSWFKSTLELFSNLSDTTHSLAPSSENCCI